MARTASTSTAPSSSPATHPSSPPDKLDSIRKTYRSKISLKLENKGTVARDHLANERTVLAWIRTSLSFCGVGVALTQLFSLSSPLTDDPIPAPPANSAATETDLQTAYDQILAILSKPKPDRYYAKPLGGLLIALGFLILIYGCWRYFQVQSALTRNEFPASRLPVALFGALASAIIIAVFAIILAL